MMTCTLIENDTLEAMQIYVLKTGLRYGPYSLEELQEQFEGGVFGAEDFASCDESESWTPIHEVPGIGSNNFAVETDPENNLLVIRYSGCVDAAAVEQCLSGVRAALQKIESDFQLLADFTELHSMDVACVPYIEEIMELCDEKGVSAVVRVIPDPTRDIGLQIMSHFHYGAGVRIMTCASMDEAMARLCDGAGAERSRID
jgi:anti-anti-sigma regulatory factor